MKLGLKSPNLNAKKKTKKKYYGLVIESPDVRYTDILVIYYIYYYGLIINGSVYRVSHED